MRFRLFTLSKNTGGSHMGMSFGAAPLGTRFLGAANVLSETVWVNLGRMSPCIGANDAQWRCCTRRGDSWSFAAGRTWVGGS
jgi:hypothetical protein